jgi:hypothetical protein
MSFTEQYDELLQTLFPEDPDTQEIVRNFVRVFQGIDHFSREHNFVGQHKVGKDAFSPSPALILVAAELRGIRQELKLLRECIQNGQTKSVAPKKKA